PPVPVSPVSSPHRRAGTGREVRQGRARSRSSSSSPPRLQVLLAFAWILSPAPGSARSAYRDDKGRRDQASPQNDFGIARTFETGNRATFSLGLCNGRARRACRMISREWTQLEKLILR